MFWARNVKLECDFCAYFLLVEPGIFSAKSSVSPFMLLVPSLKLAAKAPENGWLEYSFPFGMAYFQVLC